MITIYATGCFVGKPLTDLDSLESLDWLKEARDYFDYLGIPMMNPFVSAGKELISLHLDQLPIAVSDSVHWNSRSQVARQNAAIKESSALLVCLDGFGFNLPGTLEVMSAITVARMLEIPVMAFGLPPEHLKISPWLEQSLYSLQLSLDEALETVTDFLGFQGLEEIPEYL